jgi:hypothetical protein
MVGRIDTMLFLRALLAFLALPTVVGYGVRGGGNVGARDPTQRPAVRSASGRRRNHRRGAAALATAVVADLAHAKPANRGDHRLWRSAGDRNGAAAVSVGQCVCPAHRDAIELGLSRGRNAMAIWQDLVDTPRRAVTVTRICSRLIIQLVFSSAAPHNS